MCCGNCLTIVLIQVVGFADPKEKRSLTQKKAAQMRKLWRRNCGQPDEGRGNPIE